MIGDPVAKARWQAFEDHFLACRECKLLNYCPEGARLKDEYEKTPREGK